MYAKFRSAHDPSSAVPPESARARQIIPLDQHSPSDDGSFISRVRSNDVPKRINRGKAIAMTHRTNLRRRWARTVGRHMCLILSHQKTRAFANGAIVNICRGGLLIETDGDFIHGDRLTIMNPGGLCINGVCIESDVHGTVRWGLNTKPLSMGRYCYGVELDELLAHRHFGDKQDESRTDDTHGNDAAPAMR